jgi:hypothetical protein
MKETKTRKLVCNITGKVLFASKDYYDKKATKAGTEEILHKTYVCREARNLLKKGYSVTDIQHTLKVDEEVKCNLTGDDIKTILGSTSSLRLNNLESDRVSVIRTDPDVKAFIDTPPIVNGNRVSFVVETPDGTKLGTVHKLPTGQLINQFRA